MASDFGLGRELGGKRGGYPSKESSRGRRARKKGERRGPTTDSPLITRPSNRGGKDEEGESNLGLKRRGG